MEDPDDIVRYAPGYRPGSLSLGTSTTDSSDETNEEEEEGEEEEEDTDEEEEQTQEACERAFSCQKRDHTGKHRGWTGGMDLMYIDIHILVSEKK